MLEKDTNQDVLHLSLMCSHANTRFDANAVRSFIKQVAVVLHSSCCLQVVCKKQPRAAAIALLVVPHAAESNCLLHPDKEWNDLHTLYVETNS